MLRHQRSEDFDARYDRFLTGVGVNLGSNWAVSLLGDIVAEKEEIDPQLELGWRDEQGNSNAPAAWKKLPALTVRMPGPLHYSGIIRYSDQPAER